MINVNVTPNSGGGGGQTKIRDFPVFVRLTDNKAIGLSKRGDGVTNAEGTLFPNNFSNNQYTGYLQNEINAQFVTNPMDVGLGLDDGSYTNNQTKYKVAENFVNKWKRFKTVAILGALKAGVQSPQLAGSDRKVNDYGDLVDLGSNKFVLFYTETSGTSGNGSYAVVGTIDSAGSITWGTPVIFSTNTSSAWSDYFRACLLGTDKVAFVYRYDNGTDGVYARILTVSGTTITLGTVAQLNATGHSDGYSICKAATDKFIATYGRYNGGYRQYLRAGTVSGTTITLGGESGGSNEQRIGKLYQIGTDKCMLVTLQNNAGQNYYNYCEIITISGTTITEYSNTQLQNNSPYANDRFEVVELTTNKWLFFNGYTYQSYRNTVVFDTSGTILTRLTETYLLGFSGSPRRAYLRSYTGGIGIVDFYSESGTATLTVDANNNVTAVMGSGITLAVPLSGGNYYDVLPGKVGSNAIAFHKQNPILNTAKYSYSGTVQVEVYNNGTIIGIAQTLGMPLGTSLLQIDNTVNNDKGYLGIKNVSGAAVYVSIIQVMMEAS